MKTNKIIVRDLSWLSFNARVLQEAKDPGNPLHERLRFLGICSNNLDEFFRVRVATLNRMLRLGKTARVHLETNPARILLRIQQTVMAQQHDFDKTYADIITELKKSGIHIKNERQLSREQKVFVKRYFNEKVSTQIVPLMIESIPQMPLLHDKSIYLACVLGQTGNSMLTRYALIEIPTRVLPRFVIMPSAEGQQDIILLEDIIRFNLSSLFGPFGFNRFLGNLIKVTRDAELEQDNDVNTNIIEALERSLKNRKHGRTTRFVYDRGIDARLLDYLVKRLSLTKKDNLIPGGRIHNFKDFMDFPASVFPDHRPRRKPFVHPLLRQPVRIMKVMEERDVMLHFPYHSFDSLIDLLREAAIDPFVQSIKITCYRLAKDSKIINTLLNAVRNGKQVTVVLELRARFDEQANLQWKQRLEEEGVQVLHGLPDMKVHAKICVIKKREFNQTRYYGFVATGNLNEHTAQYYTDHCLLTTNKLIIADISRVFAFLDSAHPKTGSLKNCRTLPVSPVSMRSVFSSLIRKEIRLAGRKKEASLTLKMNSLADQSLITDLYDAAKAGVNIRMIIRGICCAYTGQKAFKKDMYAISIVDEYLEHGRIFVFGSGEKMSMFISSADWMVRNLDHRIEVACPVFDPEIRQEMMEILDIQLAENVKARILDNEQLNQYAGRGPGTPEVRSQIAVYDYLFHKKY